jgi:hypothetical protein
MATLASYDPAFDALISELSASLDQRAAFEAAARAALAAAGCSGCGAAYRVLAPLQRGYWDPPPDPRVGEPRGAGNRRPSKLMAGPPIGGPDPREGARDRRRFQAV